LATCRVDQVVDIIERAFGGNGIGRRLAAGQPRGEGLRECGAFVARRTGVPSHRDFSINYVVLSFFSKRDSFLHARIPDCRPAIDCERRSRVPSRRRVPDSP
jgi:hypothetical protein